MGRKMCQTQRDDLGGLHDRNSHAKKPKLRSGWGKGKGIFNWNDDEGKGRT
jgi:hypothetical protein